MDPLLFTTALYRTTERHADVPRGLPSGDPRRRRSSRRLLARLR